MTPPADSDRYLARPARLIIALIMLTALATSAVAPASGATSQPTGAALAQQALSGQAGCGKLSTAQFGIIGQYFMARMLGDSTAAQSEMTDHMQALWGAGGQQQAYQFMGQRVAGCATGNGPAAFGAMMGLMGAGMMGASYGYGNSGYRSGAYGPNMMGRRSFPGMMGASYGYGPNNANHMSGGAIAAMILGGLALLAGIIALTVRLARRPPGASQTHAG
jgi:hypothetical protein